MDLKNKKISEEEFLRIRKEVLNSWKTGHDHQLDLAEAVKYLKSVPEHKNFAIKLNKAKAAGITLVQPRAGVPDLDEHIKLLQFAYNPVTSARLKSIGSLVVFFRNSLS